MFASVNNHGMHREEAGAGFGSALSLSRTLSPGQPPPRPATPSLQWRCWGYNCPERDLRASLSCQPDQTDSQDPFGADRLRLCCALRLATRRGQADFVSPLTSSAVWPWVWRCRPPAHLDAVLAGVSAAVVCSNTEAVCLAALRWRDRK